jgi:Polyketide cyclase / dehydrase and lipid transport
VLAYRNKKSRPPVINGVTAVDVTALIDEAFLPLEKTLQEMEIQLRSARASLQEAKQQSITAMEAVEAAAIAQAEGAVEAVKAAEKAASRKVLADIYVAAQQEGSDSSATLSESELSQLAFEDIDYGTSEMAPPFLGEDQCLVPGEPVVRVEKAPENSRRIFAGIDIPHSVDDVWKLLTNYANLQDVVPNLVVNEVLEEYNTDFIKAKTSMTPVDSGKPEEVQCQDLANQMKGAKLRQVGGAKVAGIRFSARTTLEVREWPEGMPDFAHFNDEYWQGKSRKERAKEYANTALTRYKFPRPFAVSKLPTRDISMQSIENDDGEFRMYQGVWRMQPLPGCAPPGKEAMRLTYAVEVSPRAYLPVQLVEGRIVRDLCTNLMAIRDFLATRNEKQIDSVNRQTSSPR